MYQYIGGGFAGQYDLSVNVVAKSEASLADFKYTACVPTFNPTTAGCGGKYTIMFYARIIYKQGSLGYKCSISHETLTY